MDLILGKTYSGDTKAIISHIHKAIPMALKQTKAAAKKFQRGNARKTALAIHDYLSNEIQYIPDTMDQVIKLPKALIRHKTGDCKSYAIFAYGIAKNLGYNVKLRYSSYDESKKPTHIYTMIGDESGYYPIDGTLKKYREERGKHYFDTMEVRTITGRRKQKPRSFPGTEKEWEILTNPLYDDWGTMRMQILKKYDLDHMAGFWKKLKKGVKKVGRAIKKGAGKVLKAAAKVFPVFVAGRAAFLTIVRNNWNGIAKKLAIAFWKHPDKKNKILKRWRQFGGSKKALEKAMKKGKGIGMINGYFETPEYHKINAVALGLLVKKALPIIKKLLPFLKSILVPGTKPEAEVVVEAEQQFDPAELQAYRETDFLLENSMKNEPGSPPGTITFKPGDLKSNAGKSDEESKNNMMIPIALAAGLLLMNKK